MDCRTDIDTQVGRQIDRQEYRGMTVQKNQNKLACTTIDAYITVLV